MTAIALLGSGEFLPWAGAVDRWCIDNATVDSDRVLVIPTASAPEGDEMFARWARMGIDHYTALGLRVDVAEVRTRADAVDVANAGQVEGARLLFFSGGNPGYLAETLRDTPFWEAVTGAMVNGAAFGGCSAGAVVAGVSAPYLKGGELDHWVDGLGLLPRAFVMPHFDALESYQPGLRELIVGLCPPGAAAVGIDENTALCGDGEAWRVMGEGAVWIREDPGAELVPVHEGEQVAVRLFL